MSKQVKLRRGTTAQHASFTGALGEVTVDTDKDVSVVHDGATAGGVGSVFSLYVCFSVLLYSTAKAEKPTPGCGSP